MTSTNDRTTPDVCDSPDRRTSITAEEATVVLNHNRQVRADACRQEIAEVLQRHRCRLDVCVILRDGSVTPQVSVIPAD